MQQSFRQAVADELPDDEEIISREDIAQSMNAPTAHCLQAEQDGRLVGGAVVQINEQTWHNSLDLLFVATGEHGKGMGFAIWQAIEQRYPRTQTWETQTPYFEKRNIHFYVNKCGFKIVEFYRESSEHDELDEMFRFEKQMLSK